MPSSMNHSMGGDVLTKLRRKFIAINMGLAALVLIIAFSVVCIIDQQNEETRVFNALSETVAHNPSPMDEEAMGKGDGAGRGRGQIGPRFKDGTFSPDFPIALYSYDGTTALLLTQSSVYVAEEALPDALTAVLNSSKDTGTIGSLDLLFAKHSYDGYILIAFADGSIIRGWIPLAFGLGAAGIGALIVLFLLNLLFSRWALKPVETAWRQQQTFVADASHELKTPLTVILANNAILRSQPEATIQSQDHWIESTRLEAERMSELIATMLDSARSPQSIRAESVQDLTSVDFSRVVTGEVLTFESVAFERGLSLESNLEANLFVQGDEKGLQRVVSILLDNACKYAESDGNVSVSLKRCDDEARLSVSNSGEPIADEDLPHLFDRFYRTDKARTRSADETAGGWGLGLSIAKETVEAYGGSITVVSSSEEPTTFTVSIPLAQKR